MNTSEDPMQGFKMVEATINGERRMVPEELLSASVPVGQTMVGDKTGYYFEFRRGTWTKRHDGSSVQIQAGGLAYAGGLNKDQYEDLDHLIDAYMVVCGGPGNTGLTEYGIKHMTESEALVRIKNHIAALELVLGAKSAV